MKFETKCLDYKETIEKALHLHKDNRTEQILTEDIAAMLWAMLTAITGLNGMLCAVADEKGAHEASAMVVKTCGDIMKHVTKMRSH